jgi:RNA polymerase sigma factor (sigma-70 family)
MSAFKQTEAAPWPSGHGEAAAVVALSPGVLSERYGLRFFEGSDNLDLYDAAAIRLGSGRRLGLLRHRGNPSPGTEVHTDAHDDFLEAIQEFVETFELEYDDLIWTRDEVPPGRLRWPVRAANAGSSAVVPASHPWEDSARREAGDQETLLVENLPWIEKVAGVVCRKHGVWGDDAEDFASVVKMQLIQNDYADLRKFRGDCEPSTYIATLVVRHFHRYARERWGRWRNSAAAEREGQLAKELETLVHRDGFTVAQAAEQLRSSGKTNATDAELARILARLPSRQPLRPVAVDAPRLDHVPAAGSADSAVGTIEQSRQLRAAFAALFTALEQLPAEERQILRMRFADGRSVADVARALRLEPKLLFRRIERLRAKLRVDLERNGVTAEVVRELLSA